MLKMWDFSPLLVMSDKINQTMLKMWDFRPLLVMRDKINQTVICWLAVFHNFSCLVQLAIAVARQVKDMSHKL